MTTTERGWTPQEESERVLSRFESPLVGIVPRLFEKVHDLDDVYSYSTGAQACDAKIVLGVPCNAYNGGGSTDRTGARLAAIGETVERYSASWIPQEALRLGSYAELTAEGLHCVSPEDLRLFTDDQLNGAGFPYVRFTEDTPLWWREGALLAAGRRVWVPARLLHLSNGFSDGDSRIGYSTSSGLACGITEEEAVLGGVFELIERDAFMQVWHAGLRMPQLDPASDPELAAFLRRYAEPSGVDIRLVDMTCFAGVPTVLAVTVNPYTDMAPVALGAASAATIRTAAIKAAVESYQTRTWVKAEQRDGNSIDAQGDFHGVLKNFDDHIRLYAGGPLVKELEFLTANPERIPLEGYPSFPEETPSQLLDALVDHLDQQGIDVLAVDMTSPDVREGGAAVFRAFSPQLQPLDVGYDARYLGGNRLRQRPYELGLVPAPLGDEDLNPLPHPFP